MNRLLGLAGCAFAVAALAGCGSHSSGPNVPAPASSSIAELVSAGIRADRCPVADQCVAWFSSVGAVSAEGLTLNVATTLADQRASLADATAICDAAFKALPATQRATMTINVNAASGTPLSVHRPAYAAPTCRDYT